MNAEPRSGWIRLHEQRPVDDEVVEVIATRWRERKVMQYSEAECGMIDCSTGGLFWYPHNMAWRPRAKATP